MEQIDPERDLRNRIERNWQQKNDWCCRHMIDVEGKAELLPLVQDMKSNSHKVINSWKKVITTRLYSIFIIFRRDDRGVGSKRWQTMSKTISKCRIGRVGIRFRRRKEGTCEMPKLALEQGISIEETSYTLINILLWQLMIAERLRPSINPGRWNAEIYYYWQLIIAEGIQLVL